MPFLQVSNLDCLDKTKVTMNLVPAGVGLYRSMKTGLAYEKELIDLIISDDNALVAIWDCPKTHSHDCQKCSEGGFK